MELINKHRQTARRCFLFAGRRRTHPRRQRSLHECRGRRHQQKNLSESKSPRLWPDERATRARLRVALSGLAITEYFRDEKNQDVLLFIDNIFRFSQAGSEVSRLLGAHTSAVGYQPRSRPKWVICRSAITSTKKGSITSFPSRLCACGRPHRSCARDNFCAIWTRPSFWNGPLPNSAFSRCRSPLVEFPRVDARKLSARSITSRSRRPKSPPALQGFAGHHRDSRHGRTVARRPLDGFSARAKSSVSSASPSPSRKFSRAAKASKCVAETVRASRKFSMASTTTFLRATST